MKRYPLSYLWCLIAAAPLAAQDAVDYTRDVKPLLVKHCAGCHGPDKQRSGLRLDTAAAAREGGESGPAVVPGKSQDSPLVKALRGQGDFKQMPPEEPRLTAAQ